MTNLDRCRELRQAIQLFAGTLTEDADIMTIPSIFPAWQVNKAHETKDVFSYGLDADGKPQLYQVLQSHTASDIYPPDTATSLYKQIGITEDGIPEWVQPLGATDAYDMGDVNAQRAKVEIYCRQQRLGAGCIRLGRSG